jgi:hypothetical protein
MTFRIRAVDRTASGREIVRERVVADDVLVVGRAAENAIHLPDLAVEQRHVELSLESDGRVRLRTVGSLGFGLDGRVTHDIAVDPAEGAELELGSFLLDLSRGADRIVTITVRQSAGQVADKGAALAGFSLGGVLPGKRLLAWAGLLAILAAFLAVPIWSHLTRPPVKPAIDRPGVVMMDASWRTGALSSAHHALEDQCEACHTEPFVAVRDQTCLACHGDIADHAQPPRQAVARGPATGFDKLQWDVAHAFNKPGPGACTDCHTEHEGAGRMEPTRERFCADCHGSLDTRLSDTALGNAGDFGKLHPQFQAVLTTERGQAQPVRVSLASRPRQWDGLRFPHDMHLSKTNGVAQMARRLGAKAGYGKPLDCASCHTPTADGVRFLPVDMEEDCEACHSLVYDKVGPLYRTLRHGNVAQMRADLLALDARAPRDAGRRRPGEYDTLYRARFGGPGSALLTRAMSETGLCGECHVPAGGPGSLEVMPVTQPARYMIHGWFDHEDHKQEQCTSCHAADKSSSSTDLLLPVVAQCRDCHQGESARTAEVPSSCAMCHSYHPREGAAAAPPRFARREP